MTTLVQYNPLDGATLDNPYPVYAEMRSSEPVYWHEQMQCWVLTRYRDCQEVLLDTDVFAADWRRAGDTVSEAWLSLQSLDPPDHGPLRSLFMNALRAQDLAGIGSRGESLATQILDQLGSESNFDLISEVIAPLALCTISDLLGIDCPELASFIAISDAIVYSMDAGITPETSEPGIKARAQLSELVTSWFNADPRPGLLAAVNGRRERVSIPENAIRNTVRVVFQSGYSSVVAAAANAMLALLKNPEIIEKLCTSDLLATGFDELMRYDSAVQGISRIATKSTVIDETVVERGQIVLALVGAANRDPEQFPRPDELVLDRSPNKHMAFGRGPHTCVGNLFTREVLQALIRSLLGRPDSLRLIGNPVRKRTATMRYLDTLPVAFVENVKLTRLG